MRTPKRLSIKDQLIAEKIKAEKLRLKKIEASLPPEAQDGDGDYIRLDDLPPLHPDDVESLRQEYYDLAERVQDVSRKEQIEGYIEDWHDMDTALKRHRVKHRFVKHRFEAPEKRDIRLYCSF